MLEILYSGNFPHSQPAANNVTRKARERRAKAGPISPEWEIDDHITTLGSCQSPMKTIGVGLLNAAIWVYNVFWLKAETPASVDELSRCLLGCEQHLQEWQASTARVGADEAMIYVLSWYENISLDALLSMRVGSKRTIDPTLVQRRRERAYSFIRYAPIHDYVEGPV